MKKSFTTQLPKLPAFFHRNAVAILRTIYILYLILLCVSLGFEFRTGQSFMWNFLTRWYPRSTPPFPAVFKADVVKEVIKALGLGTLLIALVYHNFNNQMLGVRYQELVKAFTRGCFVRATVYHVITVLICIATANAGLSESACLSLGCVFFGFVYQGFVLYYIIWNPQTCECVAQQYIKVNIAERRDYSGLCMIASSLPESTHPNYQAHLTSLAEAMLILSAKDSNTAALNTQINNDTVLRFTEVWTALLSHSKVWINDRRALAVFKELCRFDDEADPAVLLTICCSYIAAKFEWLNNALGADRNVENKDILTKLSLQTESLVIKLEQTRKDDDTAKRISPALRLMAFAMLCWYNKTHEKNDDFSTDKLRKLFPKKIEDLTQEDRELVRALIESVYPDADQPIVELFGDLKTYILMSSILK